MKHLNLGKLPLIFIAIAFFIVGLLAKKNWQTSRQGGDGLGYYIYLPSVLIYEDLGDFKTTYQALKKYVPNLPDFSEDIYGFRPTPIGKIADKYPVGVAILQSPFFLVAHLIALQSKTFDPDGFSKPYQVMSFFSTLVYVIIGLYFLQKTLKEYFSPSVSAITIILLSMGTNLLFFTSIFSGMSHGYQFFVVSLLIYFTDKLYKSPNLYNGMAMGTSLGLIAIIRSQDLVLGLVPLLWMVNSFKSLSARFRFIASNFNIYIFAIIAFFMAISPQIIYYKFISGEWIYFSYVGETFNWAAPQIFYGLFSPQNGWFMYTPIMLPVVLFMFYKSEKRKIWILSLSLVLILHIYISYSWWCWYYIAGMGSRPMVDIYPLLGFPLAGLLSWIFNKSKIVAIFSITLMTFFGTQNLRFTYQQFKGYIFSEFNNAAYYWSMFYKFKPGNKEYLAYNTNFIQPDSEKLFLVDTLFYSNFEESVENKDSLVVKTGKYSLNMHDEEVKIVMKKLSGYEIDKGDWIKVTVDCFIENTDFYFLDLPKLVLKFKEDENSRTIWNQASPTALIGNKNNSIWYTGKAKEWQRVTYFTKVSIAPGAQSTVLISGSNKKKVKWNIDNLNVEVFKNK